MLEPQSSASRPTLVRFDGSNAEGAVQALLDLVCAFGLDDGERVRALGSAFVAAAVAPYGANGRGATAAHEAMRQEDGELADAVESLAPLLLGREESSREARLALAAIADLLAGAE